MARIPPDLMHRYLEARTDLQDSSLTPGPNNAVIHNRPRRFRPSQSPPTSWAVIAAAQSDAPNRTRLGGRLGQITVLAVSFLVGCSPFQLAKRTMHYELNQFPRLTDGTISCREYKKWAKQEWEQLAGASGDAYSTDYKSGFLQGFVDQVYAGGRAVPPPMPPGRYWRLPFRSQEGHHAVREWYAGFEHGARVAQEGGYRDLAVIPSSLLETGLPIAKLTTDPGTESPLNEPTPATPEPVESLPAPSADANGVTPQGLPIPEEALGNTSATPLGIEEVRAMSQLLSGGQRPAASDSRMTPDESPATPSSGLALSTDSVGPPSPPWQANSDSPPLDRPGQVALATAILPDTDSPASRDVSTAEFDPFQGTRFAELALTSADEPIASQPSTVTPPAAGLLQAAGLPGIERQDAPSFAPLVDVAPLDVIDRVPPGGLLPIEPSPDVLGVTTNNSTEWNASDRAKPGPTNDRGRRNAESDAADRKGENETTGWQPVNTQTSTQWKSADQ